MKVMTMGAIGTEVRKLFLQSKDLALNIGLISIGSIIYAIGINGVIVPHGFLTGGVLGISLLAHYFTPVLGVGFIYFCLNIPLMILGWFTISRRFMFYSLFGMVFLSWAATMIHPHIPAIQDPMLAALLAGCICGAGAGLILRSYGSVGGLDILAVFMNKKFGFQIGAILFASNALILASGAYLHDIETALYSIVYMFTSGKVVNAILTGFNRRKSIMIVSDHADEIAQRILASEGRGVTFLKGEGAFSHHDKKVIFTITTLMELPKMKQLILDEDPEAFFVVNDTLEVLGTRHGMGKVY